MTTRTPNILLRPTDTLDIAPADANRLDLREGEPVRVRSRYGSSILPISITLNQKPGELFATFQMTTVSLNNVTGPRRDKSAMTPDYKLVAVTVEKPRG